jgi:hypothetical protein
MHGVLAALGIKKGGKFNPTARQRDLLDQAANTAWKVAKTIAGNFDQQEKGLWWKDRHWVAHAKPGDFVKEKLRLPSAPEQGIRPRFGHHRWRRPGPRSRSCGQLAADGRIEGLR